MLLHPAHAQLLHKSVHQPAFRTYIVPLCSLLFFLSFFIVNIKPLFHMFSIIDTHTNLAWPYNPTPPPSSTMHRSALTVYSLPNSFPHLISLSLFLSLTCHLTIWSHLLILMGYSLLYSLMEWEEPEAPSLWFIPPYGGEGPGCVRWHTGLGDHIQPKCEVIHGRPWGGTLWIVAHWSVMVSQNPFQSPFDPPQHSPQAMASCTPHMHVQAYSWKLCYRVIWSSHNPRTPSDNLTVMFCWNPTFKTIFRR